MNYNVDSCGLVTRSSSRKANRKPFGERASSKLRCPVLAGPYAATKPKASSPKGFLLSGRALVRARQLMGLHGPHPRNTGSDYLSGIAAQPVREGLHKHGLSSGESEDHANESRRLSYFGPFCLRHTKRLEAGRNSGFTLARPLAEEE